MKKLISAVLCTALIAISVLSVAGAQITDDSLTGISFDDFFYEYQVVGEDYIPNNYVRIYKTDNSVDPEAGIRFIDNATGQKSAQCFDFSGAKDLYLPSSNGYEYEHIFHSGCSNGVFLLNFNKTGGTYQKIRVNLSKYSDYFNSHGRRTLTLGGTTHEFNFSKEFGGEYSSSLIVVSGGAVTAVTPDNNGMAEFYVSTNLGDTTFFTTDFLMKAGSTTSSGGGNTGQRFKGLTMGDTDKNAYVEVSDATCIHKHLAEIAPLSGVALRNADVNRDGKYDITDVTAIQKYLAGV